MKKIYIKRRSSIHVGPGKIVHQIIIRLFKVKLVLNYYKKYDNGISDDDTILEITIRYHK